MYCCTKYTGPLNITLAVTGNKDSEYVYHMNLLKTMLNIKPRHVPASYPTRILGFLESSVLASHATLLKDN